MAFSQVLEQLNGTNANLSHVSSSKRYLNQRIYTENIFSTIKREYDAYDDDIAIFNVFFERPTALHYTTRPSKGWIDFISAVGGNGGLFIGFSIVTILELVWLVAKLGWIYLKKV